MYTDTTFSLKVSRLSFCAMLAVMFIHSSDIIGGGDVCTWETVLLHFVGSSLTSWAVPFFFVVSGFFFWKSRDRWSNGMVAWKTTLMKKARTLLVPYLFWCAIGAVCVLPLVVWSNHVAGRALFERTFITSGTLSGSLIDCLGIDGVPIGNVPLWYVRALLSIFFLSPLFVFLIRRIKWIGFGLACACVFVNPYLSIPFVTDQMRGLGYFYFGMMLAECEWIKNHVSKKILVISGIGVLFLVVDDLLWHKCTVFLPIALMIFLWGLYDLFFHRGGAKGICTAKLDAADLLGLLHPRDSNGIPACVRAIFVWEDKQCCCVTDVHYSANGIIVFACHRCVCKTCFP